MMHSPSGWNTWDFRGPNRFVWLEHGHVRLTVVAAVWDEHIKPDDPRRRRGGTLTDTLRWQDVVRLGRHALLGLPAEMEFATQRGRYALEAANHADTLVLRVVPRQTAGQRIVFLLPVPADAPVEADGPAAGWFGGFRITLEGAAWPHDYFLNLDVPYAVGDPDAPAMIRISPDERKQAPACPPRRAVATAPPADAADRSAGQGSGNLAGTGALAEAPRAMLDVLAWNTLYDARRRLVVSPVSRDWCADWRGPIVFCWDTFFAGLMAAVESPALARHNFETALASVDTLGFVPNYVMAHGAASLDRSMPPLGAWAIWKTQAATPDCAWLAEIYPRLRRWHAFWFARRDGNGDGLLSWGSDPEPIYEFPDLLPYNPTLRHSAKAACWEAGLDNSPMYDDVPFNPDTHTLELDDVGLSSYYAMDCEALASIAETLGQPREAAAFRRERETIGRRINERLWDETAGIYCNRHWDGRFSRRWSPTSFFPLAAGIAPPERAERLVADHLLNPEEFWGEFVIPSISRRDPAFGDNDYWRGRIWGPFNLLVAEGLRRYRCDAAAAVLARKSLDLFLRNWRSDGGVYENYNAQTGVGGDVWNADRFYHWGGLLALVAIQELIDVEPDGRLRIGSAEFPDAAIRGFSLGGSRWDIELDDGVRAWRDGRPVLQCSTRAVIRLPLATAADRAVQIGTSRSGRLTIHEAPCACDRAVLPGGAMLTGTTSPTGVTFTWSV